MAAALQCCRGASEVAEAEPAKAAPPPPAPQQRDLSAVRRDIESRLHDRRHDDGSLGPLMIRYAWHACGTYDRHTKTGGSDGGTMRFEAERGDPENAGFAKAHALVAAVKAKFSWLSSADITILAGYVALECSGGPAIPFSLGRRDWTEEQARRVHGPSGCPFGDGKFNPNGSRLPAADLGPRPGCPAGAAMSAREGPTIGAMRGTFDRLGFDDKETVALIVLGHQYGRCHLDVSGFDGPWCAFDPTQPGAYSSGPRALPIRTRPFAHPDRARAPLRYAFDPAHWNCYEHGLGYPSAYSFGVARGGYRERTTRAGKRQFEMDFGGGEPFMMLIADMCLYWDESYRAHLEHYDRHRLAFREDAAAAWKKLTELGCGGRLVPEERS